MVQRVFLVLILTLLPSAPALAAQLTGDAMEPVERTAPFVHAHGGRLTVRVEDVALGEIVREIARQGGIRLFVDTPLDERVSADFADLPMEVAVRQLLRGYDCIFIADGRAAPNVALSEIWILRNDAVMRAREAEAFVGEVAALLSDADWRVRKGAVATLGQVPSDHAIGPLRAALRDADPRVREAAVEALGALDTPKVSDALRAALTDDDELVRSRAAELLAR